MNYLTSETLHRLLSTGAAATSEQRSFVASLLPLEFISETDLVKIERMLLNARSTRPHPGQGGRAMS